MSLDELLALVHEFLNPKVSHSGLDRCLRMHGVGSPLNLKAKDERTEQSGFEAYDSQYLHIDVKYLVQTANETLRGYLFVAFHRVTRWNFIAIYRNKTATHVMCFFRELQDIYPTGI